MSQSDWERWGQGRRETVTQKPSLVKDTTMKICDTRIKYRGKVNFFPFSTEDVGSSEV